MTDTERELLEKVSIVGGQSSETDLPSGNDVEKNVEQHFEVEKKRGRGRPPGSKTKKEPAPDPPPPPAVDVLTPTVAALAPMIVAKRYNRDPKDLLMTPEEQKTLSQLQPPTEWNKPSWPAYIITAISLMITKVLTSEPLKTEEPAPEPPPISAMDARKIVPERDTYDPHTVVE